MAGDGLGAEGISPDEQILRDILGDNAGGDVEDADRAIAKALQDQERAFMLLNGYDGENLWGAEAPVPGQGEESSEGEGHDHEEDDSDDDVDDNADDINIDEIEEVNDEEYARRLQEIENRARLHELAGIPPSGNIAEDYEEDTDEDGYLTEDSVDPDNMTYEELQALAETVGVVSRGLPQDIIDALPNSKYTSRFSDANPSQGTDEEEEQCAVCRMEFEVGEDVRLLPCSHFYHPACISQWLHFQKVCPICSHEVTQPGRKAEAVLGPVLDTANK